MDEKKKVEEDLEATLVVALEALMTALLGEYTYFTTLLEREEDEQPILFAQEVMNAQLLTVAGQTKQVLNILTPARRMILHRCNVRLARNDVHSDLVQIVGEERAMKLLQDIPRAKLAETKKQCHANWDRLIAKWRKEHGQGRKH